MRSCTVQAGATARMAPQGAASWAISALFAAAVLLSVAQADPDCYAPDAAVLYRANTVRGVACRGWTCHIFNFFFTVFRHLL